MKQLPPSLLNDLRAVKGFDEAAFLEAHNQPLVTSVRLHPAKRTAAWQDAPVVPWCPEGRYLSERPVFTLDPAFHAGAYYVQEASSMFLHHAVRKVLQGRETKQLRVLDLCGAPGGKSTLLASVLPEDALLISNEVIRSRASILEENMVRWGYTNSWVTSNDPKDFGRLKGYFDIIVVDAPCSGSGLFRKDQRALEDWTIANVELCCQRQQRILADVWPALKEDGVIIYATCSYSPQEDEAILDWLNEEFAVEGFNLEVPEEWGIVHTVSASGLSSYRFFPDKIKGEGFFIAAVRKKETAEALRAPKFRSQHDKKAWAQASVMLSKEDMACLQGREDFFAISTTHEPDWQLLSQHLYLRKQGLRLGVPAQKGWLPAHEIALSLDRSMQLPVAEMEREQALKFLKKEELSLPLQEKGWLLVTYGGQGLGWVKSLGNRFNNYLPKHWRIRMELPDE